MNIRATAKVLGAALAAAGLVASATGAHADVKCRQTVNKESAKLTQSIAKILQKCEQKVLDGKLVGPCPDADGATKIGDAETKFRGKIVDKCAGSTGEFAFGRCPNETGHAGTGDCTSILIQSKDDEGRCLACLAEHNAKELVQHVLYTGPLPSPGPSPNPASGDPAKCKKVVGKETVKFYVAKSKALSKCRDHALKGDIPSCPDAATSTLIADAESHKQAKITTACCGDDEVCGGAACSASSPKVICNSGANDLGPCTVDSECPGGTCASTAAGDACEVDSDCGRCRNGTTGGSACRASGQCQSDPGACNPLSLTCVGGPNDGDPCTPHCGAGANVGAVCSTNSECPGSSCGASPECPSTGSGTCQGTSGFCGGVDDLRPIQDLGFPAPCPGLSASGSALSPMGQTGASLLICVDAQAGQRATCQDAAGATFVTDLPPFCVDAPVECAPNAGTAAVTVAITTPGTCSGGSKNGKACTVDADCPGGTCQFASLGAISISLGYTGVMIPGSGDITGNGTVTFVQDPPFADSESDNDDTVVSAPTADPFGSGYVAGDLYTVHFKTCGAAPTAANFGCVVRSASDTGGGSILDGVSCQVSSIL
jgi:hypothetical protein